MLVPMARLALATSLFALAGVSPAGAAIGGATPCQGAAALSCATLTVPLDRTGADAGRVGLSVRTRQASAGPGARVALIPLAGGPGQAAIPLAGDFATSLAAGLQSRDLVVFDQRGTGRSGALRCALGSAGGSGADNARRCAQSLGRRRAHYTTPDSVEDIEAIRTTGGYDKVAFYGVSYGTKVALEYAALHPDRVERMVLDSVVTPEGPDPLQLSTFAAVPRALAQLCAGRCGAITADPGADVAALVRRLRRGPLHGRYVDARGRAHRVTITRNGLLSLLSNGDLNPVLRAETPGAIRSALKGDVAPLSRLRVRGAGGSVARTTPIGAPPVQDDGVDQSLFVTTICEEVTFPWDRGAGPATRARQAAAAINRLAPAQLAPFDRSTAFTGGLLPLCVAWPVASPAPPAFALPAIPTLLVEGQQDLRTPVEDSIALAPRLGAGTQVVQIPFVGHSVVGTDISRCAENAVGAFLSDAALPDCSATKPLVAPTRIAPRDVRKLGRTGDVPGLAGRTLTAVLATLDDATAGLRTAAFNDSPATRLGGLRAGTLHVVRGGVRLVDFSYVPGVLVSGFLPRGAGHTATLRIGGDRAARGTIRLSARRLTGRLGGRRFVLHARARAARNALQRAPLNAPFPRLARVG